MASKTSRLSPEGEVAINALLFAVRQAADIVCDRWILTLMVAAFMGESRFNGFMERTGMASRLVTSRLRTLEELGMLLRIPYSLRPLRHEYMLTVMGRDFLAVLLQMQGWELSWAVADRVSPMIHRKCGSTLHAILACGSCGQPAGARDIRLKISAAQLRHIPAKQTAHRRSSLTRNAGSGELLFLETIFAIFGDKWTVEIVNCAFLRVRRFGDFRKYTGIAANILSDRLDRLVERGIFQKGTPNAREYRLTEAGIDLYGILVALRDWADKWVADRYQSPVRLIHDRCGAAFTAQALCRCCGMPVVEKAEVSFVV